MSRHIPLIAAVMIVFAFSTPSPGQRDRSTTPRPKLGRVAEVIVSPGQLTPELDNADLRVSRVRIPAKSALSNFVSQKGLLIAVTGVKILVSTAQGPARSVNLLPAQTYWINVATSSAVNLGPECEFLYIEAKR